MLWCVLASMMLLATATDTTTDTTSVTTTTATPQTLRVGVMLVNGPWSSYALQTKVSAEAWKEHVETTMNGRIGQLPVNIDLVFVDVEQSKDLTTAAVEGLATGDPNYSPNGPVNVLVAPYSSGLTESAAIKAEELNMVLVAGGAAAQELYQCFDSLLTPCTAAFFRRFQNLYGTFTPAFQYMAPFVSMLSLKQAKRVVVLQEERAFLLSVCEGAKIAMEENGLTLMEDIYIPSEANGGAENSTLIPVMSQLVSLFEKEDKPEAFIGCTAENTCIAILKLFHDYDINFPAVVFSVCVGASKILTELGDRGLHRYVSGTVQWAETLSGSGYRETDTNGIAPDLFLETADGVPSPQQFSDLILAKTDEPANYQGASGMATFYAIHAAVAAANSVQTDALRNALGDIFLTTFYGQISFSRLGANEGKDMVLLQYDDQGEIKIVSPLNTAQVDMVYPIPRWDEREYVRKMYDTPEEIAILIMAACFVAGASLFLVFFIINRAHPVVKASGFVFSCFSIAASMAEFVFVMLWPMEHNTTTCGMLPVVGSLGLPLIMAPVVAKTYRIHKIFNNKQLTTKYAKNSIVWKYIGVLLSIQVVITTLFASVGHLETTVEVPDPIRPSHNFTTCTLTTASRVFFWLTTAYNLALLLAACWLSFKIRKVDGRFNDSGNIVTGVYFFFFGALLVFMLSITEAATREMTYIVRSVGTCVSTATLMANMWLPKVLDVIHGKPARGLDYETSQKSTQEAAGASKTGLGLVQKLQEQLREQNDELDAIRAAYAEAVGREFDYDG